MKGGGEDLKTMLKKYFPIPYNNVSENKLAFPFSKANQEKTKNFFFFVLCLR